MADLASLWNPAADRADWAVAADGGLAQEDGLRTAILISLLTDRTAAADDALPDASGDRRGWWGDVALDDAPPDPIGSRLWLIERAKSTEETRRRADLYVREALGWLLADGVAQRIDVETEWQGLARSRLAIGVTIHRRDAEGRAVSNRYDLAWSREIG